MFCLVLNSKASLKLKFGNYDQMNAVGGDGGHNEVSRISRVTAAWELTKRIRHSAALGRHVIVVFISPGFI